MIEIPGNRQDDRLASLRNQHCGDQKCLVTPARNGYAFQTDVGVIELRRVTSIGSPQLVFSKYGSVAGNSADAAALLKKSKSSCGGG